MTYRIWGLDSGFCLSSDAVGETPVEAIRSVEHLPSFTTGRYLVAKIDPASFNNSHQFGIFDVERQPPVPATLVIRKVTP